MKRFLITAGLCLVAQAGLAQDGSRPEPRPAMCRIDGTGQVRPCTIIWDASFRVEAPEAPVTRPPVVKQPVVKARKIIRLPWTIGAFQ